MKMKQPVAPYETHQDALNSFKQMIAKADSEIARLSAQEKQIALTLQANEAELQALEVQATAHETERQIAQATIDTRRKTLREAETRAELEQGTLSKPGNDLKALERLLKQSQTEQLVILDRIGKAEQGEDRRRLTLQEACEKHQRDLIQLAERKASFEATKERVWSDYGQNELDARLLKLGELQSTLNEQEKVLQMIRQDVDSFSSFALESLKAWPECQNRLSHALPFHDPTTRALEAAIGLMDALLSSSGEIERLDTELRETGLNFRQTEHLLSWQPDALYPILYRPDLEPITLAQNKTDLSNVLKLYIADKKEVRG